MKKIGLVALLLLVVAAFFQLDLHQWLSFEKLKASQDTFQQWYSANPLLVPLAYFILYVIVTALSLPGAAVMTLAGGALFGLWMGLLLVSFASSMGATLAFLVSRFLLHDTVQQRFGSKLKAINKGVEKEGAFYLFTLRLVPAFPFVLINLAMGLTPIKTWTFYWVSQVGMLAGTIVYVNAGTQLADIEQLSGILSPTLIGSFLLLGLFPLIAKKIVSWFKSQRVYKGWKKPKRFDNNMVVIGGGAAGLVSAYIAATVKAKVTLVESHKMGGDCLNYGCVPSKALIKSATLAHQIANADRFGLSASTPQVSFKAVMQRIESVVKAIEPHDSVERYTSLGVNVVDGYATIVDPWTVEIKTKTGAQRVTTRSIVIAAGASPFVPPLPGIEDSGYVTSDTLWEKFAQYEKPPQRLLILGGGPIGCELAQSFQRLGSQVTQVEMLPRLMIREDVDISERVSERLTKEGVAVLTEHKALRCEQRPEGRYLIVEHKGEEISLAYDEMICAVGRSARLTGYGLEELGIDTNKTVITDEYLATLYPNIFAAGDVAGPYQFTHTASHQAWYAAVNALFGGFKKFKADYRVIPWVTFVDPEVARVGINEQEAKEAGIRYEVTTYNIDDLDRAIAESEAEGIVKIITVSGQDKILGVTIVGSHAGELLAEFVIAMKHNIGLNKILGTIHTYPTWSEANKYVAGEWKKARTPEKLLTWVEKYHRWRRG